MADQKTMTERPGAAERHADRAIMTAGSFPKPSTQRGTDITTTVIGDGQVAEYFFLSLPGSLFGEVHRHPCSQARYLFRCSRARPPERAPSISTPSACMLAADYRFVTIIGRTPWPR